MRLQPFPAKSNFLAVSQEAHDAPPQFSGDERKKYFSLPVGIKKLTERLRTPTNQVV
jgi:hypothetical protein